MDNPIVLIVIVGAVALIRWFIENAGKSAGNSGDDTPEYPLERPAPRRRMQPPGGAANPTPTPRAESEEEKMRRFMEALGLPANGVPPPPRPAPRRPGPASGAPAAPRPIVRPAMRPAAPAPQPPPHEPVRRSIAPPLDTGEPLPKLPKSRPTSESAPEVRVTSFEPASMAQPAAAVYTAGVNVEQGKKLVAEGTAARPSPAPGAGLREELRGQLRDPAAARRAILLREILGEPKGLQSVESLSIFSPL